jgi:hypothetical protein
MDQGSQQGWCAEEKGLGVRKQTERGVGDVSCVATA